MYVSVSNLKEFYDSEIGGIAQSILQRYINEFWSGSHGLRVMGCGYATPYLNGFTNGSERVIAMMSQNQGAHSWALDGSSSNKNLVFLSDENQMPIESCSIDRILLIHHLEFCDNIQESLREVWRLLKSNGRLLVIVPNRLGVWARADFSPFGHGRPFTSSKLSANLKENLFIQEASKGALFVPPVPDSPVLMKSANLIEKMGSSIFPFVAGVHIVQASKQIYATIDESSGGSSVLAKTKEILRGGAKPVPQGFKSKYSKNSKYPKDYRD